jgi:hypothetical protein
MTADNLCQDELTEYRRSSNFESELFNLRVIDKPNRHKYPQARYTRVRGSTVYNFTNAVLVSADPAKTMQWFELIQPRQQRLHARRAIEPTNQLPSETARDASAAVRTLARSATDQPRRKRLAANRSSPWSGSKMRYFRSRSHARTRGERNKT